MGFVLCTAWTGMYFYSHIKGLSHDLTHDIHISNALGPDRKKKSSMICYTLPLAAFARAIYRPGTRIESRECSQQTVQHDLYFVRTCDTMNHPRESHGFIRMAMNRIHTCIPSASISWWNPPRDTCAESWKSHVYNFVELGISDAYTEPHIHVPSRYDDA